jgi:hypothetical protein
VARGLEVTGSLTLTTLDRRIDVTADGSRVRAEIGDLALGRPSLRRATTGYALTRRLLRVLDAASLTVDVTRHGRTVAEFGAGVRGGALARLVGLSRVRIVKPSK